jgi:hypothetical protein
MAKQNQKQKYRRQRAGNGDDKPSFFAGIFSFLTEKKYDPVVEEVKSPVKEVDPDVEKVDPVVEEVKSPVKEVDPDVTGQKVDQVEEKDENQDGGKKHKKSSKKSKSKKSRAKKHKKSVKR